MKFFEKLDNFIDKNCVAISDGVKAAVSVIGGFVAIGIGALVLHKNGIDFNDDGTPTPTVTYTAKSGCSFGYTPAPSRPPVTLDVNAFAESSIKKILERAKEEIFDSGRECAAEDIRDIAMKDGVTTAKNIAIDALSEIRSECFYPSTKSKINALIKEVAMSF